jgi:DNA-binding MarR family transcriptional regulator
MTERSSRRPWLDAMGNLWEDEGLPPIAGRLFAFLTLEPLPCSLDQLAAGLGVSKASVSTDARRLERLGLLVRTPRPGDRRDYYEVAPDIGVRLLRYRLESLKRFDAALDTLRGQGHPPTVRRRIAQFRKGNRHMTLLLRGLLDEFSGDAAPRPSSRASRS